MKDRFSAHANQYAHFRPTSPPELYDFIHPHVRHFDAVWDCGNGQAAHDLSRKFKKVCITDISAKQIGNAYRSENICYSIASHVARPARLIGRMLLLPAQFAQSLSTLTDTYSTDSHCDFLP